jgi:flagellar protein FliS
MQTDLGHRYLHSNIQTASPEGLVTMLYEGAIKFLKQARNELNQKKWEHAHRSMVRAQNIVSELALSLDKDKGRDISDNLKAIYSYINERLIQANLKKDVRAVDECIELLSRLNSTWQEAASRVRSADKAGVNFAS